MTAPTDGDYSKLLNDFARGNATFGQLPLEETGFWSALIDRVARRRARTVTAGREAAAEGLLHRPLKGPELQARNNAVVEALGNDSRAIRRLAVSLMHEYEAGTELVAAAARAAHDSDYEVRVDATRFLAKNASQQTLQPLLDVLANAPGANLQAKVDSRDSLRGSIAADALVTIGEAAVPGLTNLLSDSDTSVRWRATLCLKKIGTPETLPGLAEGPARRFAGRRLDRRRRPAPIGPVGADQRAALRAVAVGDRRDAACAAPLRGALEPGAHLQADRRCHGRIREQRRAAGRRDRAEDARGPGLRRDLRHRCV